MLFLPLTILAQVANGNKQNPRLFDAHHLLCEMVTVEQTAASWISLPTHLEALETARNSIPLAAPAFLTFVVSFLVRDKVKEVRKTLQWGRKRDENLQLEWLQSVGLCSDPEKSVSLFRTALG